MRRALLYIDICLLLALAAGLSAISVREPDGVMIRIGMVFLTVWAALWLPWPVLLPAVLAVWFGPNYARASLQDYELFHTEMLLELPAVLGLTASGFAARWLMRLDWPDERGPAEDIDEATGLYRERLLAPAVEAEVARSRRFRRHFALMFAGLDEIRQRFVYRTDPELQQALLATAAVLRSTRAGVDRVFLRGDRGFALLLPETGPDDVEGMLRRLSRVARRASPAEGEPGGPLPMHFGVTFYPQCATTAEDLLTRAGIAVRLAESRLTRLQIDSAEAEELPAPEKLRRPEPEEKPPWLEDEEAQAKEPDVDAESADGEIITGPWSCEEALETRPALEHANGAVDPVRLVRANAVSAAEPAHLATAVENLQRRIEETLALIRSLRAS